MSSANERVRLLWAKSEGRNGKTHPLVCHMIDTASVVEAMWRLTLSHSLKGGIAALFGADQDEAGEILSFLAGLHDIGKPPRPSRRNAQGSSLC